MAGTLAFFDQLQGESYSSLSSTNFKVGITDPDDAPLTSSQLSSLAGAGKTVVAYLSIGEAEDYRSYWQSSWSSSPPSFIIGENPDWPGNFNVKYWDSSWQNMMVNKAVSLAKAGYGGIMLDVVDSYGVSAVANAAGGIDNARNYMMQFVEKISEAAKAVNPDFKIIQNNALDLLTTNPDDPSSSTNHNYLSHIDALVAESTYYNPDNTRTSWGDWNIQYLEHAVADGKTVFAIDYPSSSSAQSSFISKAIADGFVPYVATQSLNSIPSVNYNVLSSLPSDALASVIDSSGGTSTGGSGGTTTPPSTGSNIITATSGSMTLTGSSGDDIITALKGNNTLNGNAGNDELHGAHYKDILTGGSGSDHLWGGGGNDRFGFSSGCGNDTIHDWHAGNMIDVSHNFFSSRAQVLSHVTYANGNAVVHLDSNDSITLLGVAAHSLTADSFHIT